ncbi:hypothetical protein PARHAE_03903 [Paracoccus haematequi]|uniref:DUF2585 family protein n=1 Tax=Paracoccus haematequi TaxID=2491866 RepID=A0A447ITA9_9RHOB|nr:DUF2585 family protein [Paracoccus haematequi]VDS10685.1 hypothetical protein PARHAE_03903 [Paracoccus haematequi]
MTNENRSVPPFSPERSASLTLVASELPQPRGRGRQAALLIGLALLGKLVLLAILGRPAGCDCGQIWAMPGQAGLNSRTLLDPYSLLHLIFGAVLVKLVRWKRPDWPLWTLLAAVIVSSTVWEVAENLPFTIAMFGYDPGDPLAYRGDSIANSFSDTAAAALGAVLALPLAGWVVAAAAVAVELGLTLWIGDGYLITLWRALGF